jgi:hypothetical protein
MANIEEMKSKMTIYYNKRTGDISRIAGGIQDMSLFGVEEEDFKLIYDFIVIDDDIVVMRNMDKFKVENDKLKLNEDLSKYL